MTGGLRRCKQSYLIADSNRRNALGRKEREGSGRKTMILVPIAEESIAEKCNFFNQNKCCLTNAPMVQRSQ